MVDHRTNCLQWCADQTITEDEWTLVDPSDVVFIHLPVLPNHPSVYLLNKTVFEIQFLSFCSSVFSFFLHHWNLHFLIPSSSLFFPTFASVPRPHLCLRFRPSFFFSYTKAAFLWLEKVLTFLPI